MRLQAEQILLADDGSWHGVVLFRNEEAQVGSFSQDCQFGIGFPIFHTYTGRAYMTMGWYKVSRILEVREVNRLLRNVHNINPFDESADSFITDAYSLKEILNKVILGPGWQLVSIDVIGLYPNLPLVKALEITRITLEEDLVLLKKLTPLSVDQIMEIMITVVVLETYFVLCDSTRNQQLNGCPIGKALSVPVAGIYMCWWEKQFKRIRSSSSNCGNACVMISSLSALITNKS